MAGARARGGAGLRGLLLHLVVTGAWAANSRDQGVVTNTLERVSIDVSGDGKRPMVVEVERQLPPLLQLRYNVTGGGGDGPVVIDLTEELHHRSSPSDPPSQDLLSPHLSSLRDPPRPQSPASLRPSQTDSPPTVIPREQGSNIPTGELAGGQDLSYRDPSVPVECPPCLCMLAEEQAARANYVLTPWPADNTTVATTTQMAASTTTTTTTSTTTTPTTTTSTPTSTTPPPPVPCGGSQESHLCLSESCVMAAGTILNSMDRSVSPCDDFYQFACGGWAQRSPALNMDRFQAIDRRNQNIIRSELESEARPNISDAEQKARTFYHSCVAEREATGPEDLLNLQAVLEFSGGWAISGEQNTSMPFTERMFRLQNQLGVSALFTWGVIAENGSTHIAVVPGGWMEDQLEDPTNYLKLMAGISWLLAEASKCPAVEYVYEVDKAEEVNNTMEEVEYEYSYGVESPRFGGIFQMFSSMFSGEPEVAPGDYYDYDFIHETNDSDFLGIDASYNDVDIDQLPPPPALAMLQEEEEATTASMGDHNTPLASMDPNTLVSTEDHKTPVPEPEHTSHHSSRENCLDRLKSEMDLTGPALAALVAQRLDLEEAMREVQGLERRLRNLTTSGPDSTDGALTPVTLRQLQRDYNFLDWIPFLQRSFQIIEHELTEDSTIMISEDYLRGVTELVAEYSATPASSEVLRNYLAWRLVAQFYPSKYRDEARRGEQCLKQTEDVFGPVITAMYVRHKTVEASETLVEEVATMVDTMKEAFSATLQHLPWMSLPSRTAALEKLAGMMDLIGYPEQVLNSTWLNAKYAEVEVTEDYLMNIVAFQSHQRKEGMRMFTRPYKRGSWVEMSHGGSIVTVNAFYSPNSNTMIVPIGMLQDPLYWSQPKSLTFGAFGIVVAHEITHAFDDSGINHNSEGMTAQLYDEATISAFHREAACLSRQYSQYTVADTAVDGNLTLGENLADHGGLSMALAAYSQWRKDHLDHRLPALPFDDMQLFFIGYALPWCSVHTKKHVQSQVEHDEHAPERFRVLGPLSNSPEFSQAFSCPLGSPMNPEEKCEVW